MSERAAHRPSRRHVLVGAAIGAFGRDGVADTTMDHVARVAGVAPNAIYYHFATKDALLLACVEHVAAEINDLLAPDGVMIASLRDAVRSTFEWVHAHPDAARVFFVWSLGTSPEIADRRERFVALHAERLRRFLPTDTAADLLAARTAIGMNVATSVAWLADDVLPPGTDTNDLTAAVVAVMGRLIGRP